MGGRTLSGQIRLRRRSIINFAVVPPHVHERDAFWEMKEKAKRTNSLTV